MPQSVASSRYVRVIAVAATVFAASAPACSSDSDDSDKQNGTGGSAAGASVGTGGSSGASVSSGGATGGSSMGGASVGTGGSSGGATGGSAAGGGSGGSDGGCVEGEGTTAPFSFFVTSLAGLRRLSGSQNGFGGDLRFGKPDGLSGADEICRQLAEDSYAGAGCKTWRAFLSVTKDATGNPVHAIDRVGTGPWYDRLGRIVAMTRDDLLQTWPRGADPAIIHDLPNEFGVPNHNPDGTGNVDNHNTMTGTGADGKVAGTDWGLTCHDWTTKVGADGAPRVGFSWLGGAANFQGSRWYASNLTEAGCADYINLTNSNDTAQQGVGSGGGYGGFYCLALTP